MWAHPSGEVCASRLPLFSLSGTANYVFGYKGGKQNLTASLKNIASIAPGAGF
ncbi:hypothetical protein HOE425_332787 [Hoeflea sp. EC-HK425]|nr:hypothetical protein HOE425_332787 [Hoeflea sp. EC-HK425]